MTRRSGLVVEEVRSAADLADRLDEWEELSQRAPAAEIFETPAWITAWLSAYWQDRPLAFCFVRSGEELVGVAPLLDDEEGRIGCRHSLVTPVNAHARRCGILHAVEPDAVLTAVLEHLDATRRAPRLRIRCEDAAAPLVGALQGSGHKTLVRPKEPSPIIRIRGSWDDYLATRPTHLRRELARKERKLQGSWSVEWHTEAGAHEHAMTEVLRIERASWKDREGTSMCSEPGAAAFYTRLARECARRDWLRVEVLHLDGRPVAHVFGVVFNRVYYALKTSYDEAYRGWSPGIALFRRVIEQAFGDGLAVFDFLGSGSRWKAELANDVRRHVDACSFADGAWRCRWDVAKERRVKPLLERHAPVVLEARRRVADRIAHR